MWDLVKLNVFFFFSVQTMQWILSLFWGRSLKYSSTTTASTLLLFKWSPRLIRSLTARCVRTQKYRLPKGQSCDYLSRPLKRQQKRKLGELCILMSVCSFNLNFSTWLSVDLGHLCVMFVFIRKLGVRVTKQTVKKKKKNISFINPSMGLR